MLGVSGTSSTRPTSAAMCPAHFGLVTSGSQVTTSSSAVVVHFVGSLLDIAKLRPIAVSRTTFCVATLSRFLWNLVRYRIFLRVAIYGSRFNDDFVGATDVRHVTIAYGFNRVGHLVFSTFPVLFEGNACVGGTFARGQFFVIMWVCFAGTVFDILRGNGVISPFGQCYGVVSIWGVCRLYNLGYRTFTIRLTPVYGVGLFYGVNTYGHEGVLLRKGFRGFVPICVNSKVTQQAGYPYVLADFKIRRQVEGYATIFGGGLNRNAGSLGNIGVGYQYTI